jgi:hypothetical protein
VDCVPPFWTLNNKFEVSKNVLFTDSTTCFETNPAGFHFYDLDYSLSCHKEKLKLGVSDIMITHSSPGLKEFTSEFNEGQQWFLNKWKGKL